MTTSARELALRISRLEEQIKSRASQLAYSSIEGGVISEFDELGNLAALYGTQFDGSHMAMAVKGITPLTPTAPVVALAGPITASVRWDGLFTDGTVIPTDFSRLEVHASQTNGFPANMADTLFGTIESPRGGELTLTLEPGTWYFRFVARNTSGDKGPVSAQTSAVVEAVVSQTVIDGITADVAAANAAASAAQTSADGKNQIVYSTSDASGTTGPTGVDFIDGDLWRKRSGSQIVAEWRYAAGAWVSQTISGAQLTNLDAGSITVGQLAAGRLAVDSVLAANIKAGEVTAGKLAALAVIAGNIAANAVTAGTIAAGAVTAGTIAANAVTASTVAAGAITASKLLVQETANLSWLNETIPGVVANTTVVTDGASAKWTTRTDNSQTFLWRDLAGPIPFKAGDRIRVTYEAYTLAGSNSATPRIRYTDGTGWNLTAVAGGPTTTSTAVQGFAYEGDVPDTIGANTTFSLGFASSTGVDVRVRNVRAYRMGAGELIVDGQITAAKLAAGSVTAAAIQAGAVVAGKVAAGAISTENLAVGVLRTNLVADPSFEENYVMGLHDPGGVGAGDVNQWRYEAITAGSSVSNNDPGISRSGAGALRITAPALGGQGVVSPAFPVVNGATYRVVVSAACLDAQTKLVMSVLGGNTPTEPNIYSVIPKVNDTDPPYPISNKALTSNVATLTTSVEHDYQVGDPISVTGVDATFNGWFYISAVPSTTSFSYAKTAANVASTAATGSVEKVVEPPLLTEPVDSSGYRTYSWTFSPTASSWAVIRLVNFLPNGTSRLIVDDVSVFKAGAGGGSELTAAGLRIFDPNGLETGAFVSNRANYFSFQNNGETVATVSARGNAMFQSVAVVGDQGTATSLGDVYGLMVGGRDVADRLWDMPQGQVSSAYPGAKDYGPIFNEVGLFETSFFAYPGRTYEFFGAGFQFESNSQDSQWELAAKYTTDGSSPLTTSASCGLVRAWDNMGTGQDFSFPMLAGNLSPVPATDTAPKLIRIGVSARVVNNGTAGTGARLTVHSYASAFSTRVWVNDVGPYDGNNVVDNKMGGAFAGGSTSPDPAPKTKYVTYFTANSSESYGNFGARPESQLYQGYFSSNQGHQWTSILFTAANSYGSESGKSIATALSGATIARIELFVKNLYWYNTSGTAYVRAQTSTSLISTTPTGTAKAFGGFARGDGKWLDITSIASSSIRGVTLGKAPSTSLGYYGYFANHAAATGKPCLRITYYK